MATVLQLLQDFCDKWGLPTPSGVVGSTDTTYKNLLALSREVVRDIVLLPLQELRSRVTFVTIAAESQGTLATVFGAGYGGLVAGTMWNVTDHRPVFGPDGDISWQAYKSFVGMGVLERYKVMGGNLHITPAPAAGRTLSVMIQSKFGVVNAAGTPIERIAADSDTLRFPDNVFLADLEWRWLRKKGQAWTTSYDWAQNLIGQSLVKDGSMPNLHMDVDENYPRPGIYVPYGGVV